jgi:hypothetical protein
MNKTESKVSNAIEAKEKSQNAQASNVEKALNYINTAANDGYQDAILFGCYLSFEGVRQLMELGFSVAEFIHPLEQRKLQRVSW